MRARLAAAFLALLLPGAALAQDEVSADQLAPPSGSDSADSAPAGSDSGGEATAAPSNPDGEYYSEEDLAAPLDAAQRDSRAPAAATLGSGEKAAISGVQVAAPAQGKPSKAKRGAKLARRKGKASAKPRVAQPVVAQKPAPKSAAKAAAPLTVSAVPLTPVVPYDP